MTTLPTSNGFRPCRICGTGVPTSGRPGRPSTYCSEDCRKQGSRQFEVARRTPSKNRYDGVCPRCTRNPRSVTPSGRMRGWCRGCEAADKASRRVNDPQWRERANATVRAYRRRANGQET
jgi:hypothetical protein